MDLGVNIWGSSLQPDGQYSTPSNAEIDYFAAKGFTNIRLSLSWEDIQQQLNGPLNADFLPQIEKTVAYARSQGMDVILDIHNYGSYDGKLIGSSDVPLSAFADLWGKIAAAFADDSNVRFDLMNEPLLATSNDWLNAANAAISAIREAGAHQQVLVAGTYGPSWTQTDVTVLGAPGAINDPDHNYAFDVHQYLDDTSGQNSWVVSETIGVERLTAITEWARANGAKLYLGEFGVADNAESLAALDNMMKYVTDNQDVWQSASYWVAGTANPTYMYSVQPDFGLLDQPQMDVLENYASGDSTITHLGDGTTRIDYTPDGRTVPTMSDILSAEGVLISRTLFDADGDEVSQATIAADGGVTVKSYSNPGQAFPYECDVYNASQQLLTRTVADTTGATTVQYYDAGAHDPYHQENYTSAGTLTSTQDFTSDGVTGTNYVNGVISTVEHYSRSWTLLDRETYDSEGRLAQMQTDNADGSHTITLYNVLTGKISGATVYSSSWFVSGTESYDSNGNITSSLTYLANGYREIDHYTTGVLSSSDTMTSDSKLVSHTTYTSTGYQQTVYAAPGSTTLAEVKICSLDGTVLSLTKYDADGLIALVQHYNPDGSFSQDTYDANHQAHPALVTHYAADGTELSYSVIGDDGHAARTVTIAADGGETIQYFVAGTDTPSTTEVLGAKGNLESRTTYDANGLVSNVLRENADGTHALDNYTAADQRHVAYTDTFDASWTLVSRTQYDTDGHLTAIDTINSDGTHTVQAFANGGAALSSVDHYTVDWRLESRVSYDANGLITTVLHENADGTHSVDTYDDHHQRHPAYTDTYDAAWTIASRTQYDSDGAVTAIDTVNGDGTHTVQAFDKGIDTPSRVEVYTADWHLESRVSYDADGLITTIRHENGDGTHTIDTYTATAQDHATSIDQFDADWTLLSRSYYNDTTLTAHVAATEDVTAGIDITGGGDTVLINKGTVSSNDVAVQDTDGDLKFVNHGEIDGNVDLGSGADVFNVRKGGFDGIVFGGSGDDLYQVSSSDIQINELAGDGTDTVESSADMTLPDAVENLVLTGRHKVVGMGNDLDNDLTGSRHRSSLYGFGGDDTLWGGGGRDVLTGGDGSDTFVFKPNSGVERVSDFQAGVDKLSISSYQGSDFDEFVHQYMNQHGDNVVIHDGSDRMILEHVQISDITAGDFLLT